MSNTLKYLESTYWPFLRRRDGLIEASPKVRAKKDEPAIERVFLFPASGREHEKVSAEPAWRIGGNGNATGPWAWHETAPHNYLLVLGGGEIHPHFFMQIPKPKRMKDEKALKIVRSRKCLIDNRDCIGATEPHHVKTRGAGGDDTIENLMPLCHYHHDEAGRLGRHSFIDKYGIYFDHDRNRWNRKN